MVVTDEWEKGCKEAVVQKRNIGLRRNMENPRKAFDPIEIRTENLYNTTLGRSSSSNLFGAFRVNGSSPREELGNIKRNCSEPDLQRKSWTM
jgi:hypothetical protein